MNTYTFRPAVREQVGLLMGLIGPSGSGKTYSAMRLASGICGNDPFAVIDTEARRALHYAEMFRFDHCELDEPFRPNSYAESIKAADKAGYKAIVVDSTSHEWAGVGGVLEWHEEELSAMVENAMKRGDNRASEYQLRESMKMRAWIKPKTSHKAMIQRLLQIKASIILCFRAEEKVKMEKDEKGKIQIVPIGWQPVCSKELPYELTVSFLLTPDRPGIPQPLKLQEQHRALFPLNQALSEESGRLIAEWAKGSAPQVQKSLLESALAEIAKCSTLDELTNHWKKHSKTYAKDPKSAEITAAKDKRKQELSETIWCPGIEENVPKSRCDACNDRTGCPAHEAA